MSGDRGLSAALVAALGSEVPPPFAVRRFSPLPTLSYDLARQDGGVLEREFDVDQTNHSVVVDERVVVKWLTPPAAMPHPTPEMWAHLVSAGFACTAPPYAAVTRAQDGEETLLALVTGYLPEATDGWEWCTDEAEAGHTDFAEPVGRLAADLHLALAGFPPSSIVTKPPTVTTLPANDNTLVSGENSTLASGEGSTLVPEEDSTLASGEDSALLSEEDSIPSSSSSMDSSPEVGEARTAVRAERALEEALALTDGEDGAWLAAKQTVLRAEFAPLAEPISSPLIRIHGDLHVGQILRWRDGYAVIDFDGNPTLTGADPYQPAARDVAQLATSLEHVAQVAVLRRGTPRDQALAWARESRDRMLAAYRDRLAERGRPDLLDGSLLRPFEIEQECRELVYAARHLPRWRYAPMGVLRARYPEETP